MIIWFVDAFSSKPFKGNPAAVCIVESFPEVRLMQNIASEIGYSETAFVMQEKGDLNHYKIRWFTPNSEAPLCGHATIAAAHVLIEENHVDAKQEIKFSNNGIAYHVTQTGSWLNLKFPAFDIVQTSLQDKLSKITQTSPIFVGISENVIIAEFLKSDDIRNCTPDLQLLARMPYRALIITSKDLRYDFISRYFAPRVAIDEDPVCASAHCRLIPYWASKLNKNSMVAYQASKRGGIIKCINLKNNVLISGEAVTILKGKLNII